MIQLIVLESGGITYPEMKSCLNRSISTHVKTTKKTFNRRYIIVCNFKLCSKMSMIRLSLFGICSVNVHVPRFNS